MNNKNLTSFKWLMLESFPFIEGVFEEIDNYRLLCKIVEYLNKIKDKTNITGINLEKLSVDFTNLKEYVDNYFKNLDVQDEINKKLDEMSESGQIADIIANYIQLKGILVYETVSSMKSAENLVDGSFAETYGFYNKGDGGSAKYKVRQITNLDIIDEMTLIALNDNQLVAELIMQPEMNVAQFGAKGDGIRDDQNSINKALSSSANKINLIREKTYMVKGYEQGQPQGFDLSTLSAQTGIIIPSNKIFDLNFGEIKIITNDRQNYNAITLQNVDNVIIKNGKITGDVDSHTGTSGEWGYGISLRKTNNITLSNLYISKMWGDGINLKSYLEDNRGNNTNILITDTICDDNRRQGMSIEQGIKVIIQNSQFNNTGTTAHTNPSSGVDVEPTTYETVKNIEFINCKFNNNYNSGLLLDCRLSYTENILVDNCEIIDNLATSSYTTFYADNINNLTVRNTKINNSSMKVCRIIPRSNFIFRDNYIINNSLGLTSQEATNETFIIENNIFEVNVGNGFEYNGLIETIAGSSTRPVKSGNKLLIIGNKFYNKNTNHGNNIYAFIAAKKNCGFDSVEIVKNIMFEGTRHILIGINGIVKNNEFIASNSFSIYIDSQIDNMLLHIENNLFEQISWLTNHAGIISNPVTVNISALNNTIFSKCINNAFTIEEAQYNSSRLLQSQTTSITAPIKTEIGTNYFDNNF